MKISTRLTLLIALFSSLLLIVGTLGLRGISSSNAALKTVYEDRVIALGQLEKVSRLVLRNRVLVTDALLERTPEDLRNNLREFDLNLLEIDKQWKEYAATYLTPEEKKLADTFPTFYKALRDDGYIPIRNALERSDYATAQGIYQAHVSHKAGPLAKNIDDLVQIQFSVSKSEYDQAVVNYNRTSWQLCSVSSLGF